LKTVDKYHQLLILETLESNPEITQADLASRVGIAVGTVNWYLKQWSKKGWIKIKRIGRWRWQYLLTPRGMAEKARLAKKYLEHSMRIYNQIREQSKNILEKIISFGYTQVVLDTDGDLADIFRLTCLELGIGIEKVGESNSLPRVCSDGSKLTLIVPGENEN
jgi:DNA-binding MarR family transcriptional regulator